jgi:hypothetical protein
MLKPIKIDASQFVKRYYSLARFTVNMEDFIASNFLNSVHNKGIYSDCHVHVPNTLTDLWAAL